jgi:transcription-repair coupling factor (superfamily II helicase)
LTHPAIRDLFQSLGREAAFQEAVGQLLRDPHARLSLSGLTTTAKALYTVLLWQATERPLIVIADGNKEAETLAEAIETFFDLLVTADIPRPQLVPALDVLPSQRLSPHSEIAAQRAIGLWRIANRRAPITVTPVASALLRTESAEFYRQLALTLRVNEEIPLEDLIAHLESVGYERREPVEMVGDYSLRGGILDIFPAENSKPVRIELFGDLIESIRRFDVDTQRSVLKVNEVTVLPIVEYPKSRALFHAIAEQIETPSPGDAFSGWEYCVPLVRPRSHSLFTPIREGHVWTLNDFDPVSVAEFIIAEFDSNGSVKNRAVKPERNWSTAEGISKNGQTSFPLTSGIVWAWLPAFRTFITANENSGEATMYQTGLPQIGQGSDLYARRAELPQGGNCR